MMSPKKPCCTTHCVVLLCGTVVWWLACMVSAIEGRRITYMSSSNLTVCVTVEPEDLPANPTFRLKDMQDVTPRNVFAKGREAKDWAENTLTTYTNALLGQRMGRFATYAFDQSASNAEWYDVFSFKYRQYQFYSLLLTAYLPFDFLQGNQGRETARKLVANLKKPVERCYKVFTTRIKEKNVDKKCAREGMFAAVISDSSAMDAIERLLRQPYMYINAVWLSTKKCQYKGEWTLCFNTRNAAIVDKTIINYQTPGELKDASKGIFLAKMQGIDMLFTLKSSSGSNKLAYLCQYYRMGELY